MRYWAAGARPGVDTAVDPNQMRVGRRLAMKILNASRFVLGFPSSSSAAVIEPLDRAMLSALSGVVADATAALDALDYARALERIETFFWTFCDDYVELVKGRAYGDGPAADSARTALRSALDVLLRLFAPMLPFVTEEVWSWSHDTSIHTSSWPVASERGDASLLAVASELIGAVRRAKAAAGLSMRAEAELLTVPIKKPPHAETLENDLLSAAHVKTLAYRA